MTVTAGDTAPNFSLTNSADMKPISLADYQGKNVVLAFFPAAFSGVCKTELCTFSDSLASFESLDAQVIGISVDPPMAQKEFADQNGVKFPVLSDMHGKAIKDYGLEFENFAGVSGYTVARRSVVVIGKDGKVSWTWLADSPGNEPPYNDVEAAVKALN
jgi:peroxiredoxin